MPAFSITTGHSRQLDSTLRHPQGSLRLLIEEQLEKLASVKDLPEGALSSLIAHKHLLSVKRGGARHGSKPVRRSWQRLKTSRSGQPESMQISNWRGLRRRRKRLMRSLRQE